MKRLFPFLCLSILLASCSKSEKDFVGVYKTYFSTRIEIEDFYTSFSGMFRQGKSTDDRSSASIFDDLGEIRVELFIDQQKNGLAGEAVFNLKLADNQSLRPGVQTRKIDLDVSNIRLKGDTLEFTLDNQSLKNAGKRIKGKIVKRGELNVLGLGQDLVLDPHMKASPFFLSQEGGMVYYGCPDEKISHEKIHTFFQEQETYLLKKIQSEKSLKNKHTFENSLADVRARLK